MKESERLQIYLERMLDAIQAISNHTKTINVSLIEKHPLQLDATLMQLIHIGEIMQKIKKSFPKIQLENIKMEKIIGFRNFAAHDYIGVNTNIVKVIIQDHLPILHKAITKYLESLKS